MSPRPYALGKRQAATEETRAQIVAATRQLLSGDAGSGRGGGSGEFSIDAVARVADVARMTVYHRFGSRAGLLEAVFDDFAMRGEIASTLPAAMAQPDPRLALDAFIAAFGRLWQSDRRLMRRLHALGVLDPEVGAGQQAREERRRQAARVLVARLAEHTGAPRPGAIDLTADLIFTLTAFETFDILAGTEREPREVIPLVQRLARAAAGVPPDEAGGDPPPPTTRPPATLV